MSPLTIRRYVSLLMVVVSAGLFGSSQVTASGISIDAGLTPPGGRWIFRSQIRYLHRNEDPTSMQREMTTYMTPLVVAYGLTSDITLMARQLLVRKKMTSSTMSSSDDGLGDLFLMAKYKAIRINTRRYTLGLAPTIGLELPTGAHRFTSETWDLHLGFFLSGRYGSWALDFNTTYVWNGLAKTGQSAVDPGNGYSSELALANQITIGADANLALAPVLELIYQKSFSDRKAGSKIADSGGSLILISPGFKVTRFSFIIEGLVQFPVWQDNSGQQLERDIGFLAGARFMY